MADSYNEDEDEKSPKYYPRIIPKGIRTYKIPLTEYNTCPFCNGKGFVKVITDDEKDL